MSRIAKYDPFHSLFSLPRMLEDFDDFGQRGLKIRETESEIIAEAVVAGIPAKDVDVDIENGILTIKGESHDEDRGEDQYKSSSYQYYYTVALSGGEWDKADAEVKHGVVTVRIPKSEALKPRKISVRESKEK